MSTHLAAFLVGLTSLFMIATSPTRAEEPVVFEEPFDGEFVHDWTIVREQEDHYDFETAPGELLITTTNGTMYRGPRPESQQPRNVFLLDHPVSDDADFVATLHVTQFDPSKKYHQVGILFYQGDDNFVKFSAQRDWRDESRNILHLETEVDAAPKHNGLFQVTEQLDGPFWLRLARENEKYVGYFSDDGETFELIDELFWGLVNDGPIRIGFVAKNGYNLAAPEIEVKVESFRFEVSE